MNRLNTILGLMGAECLGTTSIVECTVAGTETVYASKAKSYDPEAAAHYRKLRQQRKAAAFAKRMKRG